MAHFDKARVGAAGFTYQVGTLSGNPVASVAGLKTLDILKRPGNYEYLNDCGERLMLALGESLASAGIAHQIVGDPVVFDVVFRQQPVLNYRDLIDGNSAMSARFNQALRQQGILKPAGKFYTSLALQEQDIQQTIAAMGVAADSLKNSSY